MQICTFKQIRTFVILDFPSFALIIVIFPVHVLRNSEESLFLLALDTLNNGRDELFQEPIDTEQGWPEMMEEIDEQPLDMRSIMILICHNHQVTVSEL